MEGKTKSLFNVTKVRWSSEENLNRIGVNWNGSQRRSEPEQISFVSNSIPHSDKNWSNKKFVRIQNHKQASESRDAFVAAFNHPLYSQRKKNTRVKKRNEEREREKSQQTCKNKKKQRENREEKKRQGKQQRRKGRREKERNLDKSLHGARRSRREISCVCTPTGNRGD